MKNQNDIKTEVICGYKVSENRKRLWVVEISMLQMLEKACKDNGINYFLLFGSAIGAVRHNGFIPWDDDIDIGMLREDFEIFLKNGRKYFPDYIDIQYGIGKNRFDNMMRIRDSRTTGIIKWESSIGGNKGAFIEIYPFDYVDNNLTRKIQIRFSQLLCSVLRKRINKEENKKIATIAATSICCIFKTDTLWKLYNKVCTLQNKNKRRNEWVDTIALPNYAITGQHLFRKKDVEESIYHEFEYVQTRIPKGYHSCLTIRYGDYMKIPPIEDRGVHHDSVVFYDPNRSYKEYEKNGIPEKYFNGDLTLEQL